MERLLSAVGLVAILAGAWAFSADRRAVRPRTVAWGMGLQLALALFVLKVSLGQRMFAWLGEKISALLGLAFKGSEFVFGPLGKAGGGSIGFIFAFQVLPTIIFVAALFAILYHLGIMQVVVTLFARVMTRLMGASGAESLNAAAGVFMGQTEAPLTIRPYLNAMTDSELLCVMTSGMAHISAGIMGAYIFVAHVEPKYLLASMLMTAPGSILVAKMLLPEKGTPQTAGTVKLEVARTDANLVGAAARGTSEGLSLAINVAAMLISFLALIALVNVILGVAGLSLERVLGWVFSPVALLMGVPLKDVPAVGSLLGLRIVTNEFVAYTSLGPMKEALDPRSFTIATFALCGFANLSSIGIQIGGIGALVPERKADLSRLGVRALVAGTLANFMTACMAGMLL
jgi:concentrative nucleoside transporter, CNT family